MQGFVSPPNRTFEVEGQVAGNWGAEVSRCFAGFPSLLDTLCLFIRLSCSISSFHLSLFIITIPYSVPALLN